MARSMWDDKGTDDAAATRQNYPKTARGDAVNTGEDKQESMRTSSEMRMTGGGDSGENEGPTGSSRSYPKGTRINMDGNRLNPMKCETTGLYVDGVGKDE